jgi:O-succinylbenzoic acid--CoA ligase
MDVRDDAPAVLDGSTVWSNAELHRRAEGFAAKLSELGIRSGDRVGLIAASSAATIAAFHGCLRSGIVAVPIAPRLTAPEIDVISSAARLRAIVSGSSIQSVARATAGSLPADSSSDAIPTTPGLAVIVTTSGTTGRPKLVRLTRSQLEASAAAWSAVLPPATAWLLSLNMAHVSGIGIVVRAARAGVPVVVPRGSLTEDIAAAADAGIAVSHVSLVPTQLTRLLDSNVTTPPQLRAVILGGGPIPAALVAAATVAGWPVLPSYGLTETASGVVVGGRPMPGVNVRIAYPDATAVADGRVTNGAATEHGLDRHDDVGEIVVRGPMVFDGYEGDPDLTAAALDRDGWLHTGDLGRIDADGLLQVVGRRDEMIVSGGENVAPAEVEAVLAAHPAIADVAVTGMPDEEWGSVPVALVVYRPGTSPTDDDLRVFGRERLASFKVPRRFVAVPELPRSANGKLLRRSLGGLVGAAGRRPSLMGTTAIRADDGQPLAVRILGDATAPNLLMLHATVSTSGQLLRLAGLLRDDMRVVLMDRRGSGASRMETPGPVSIARHIADIVDVLDGTGTERTAVFGHSFGALLALELAARHSERVTSVVAYEPPYLPLAEPRHLARLASVHRDVAAAFASGGAAAATQTFLRAVAGDEYWDRLPAPQRAVVEADGAGALADTSMSGLDPAGLAGIACPVTLVTGGDSDPLYAPIADALSVRIPDSRRIVLPGLRHPAPITDSAAFVELLRPGRGN